MFQFFFGDICFKYDPEKYSSDHSGRHGQSIANVSWSEPERVVKGIATEADTEMCIKLGVDGIVASNHGGRQLDAGQSAIKSMNPVVDRYKGKIKIMMDSGLRSGPDVARVMASGADISGRPGIPLII